MWQEATVDVKEGPGGAAWPVQLLQAPSPLLFLYFPHLSLRTRLYMSDYFV